MTLASCVCLVCVCVLVKLEEHPGAAPLMMVAVMELSPEGGWAHPRRQLLHTVRALTSPVKGEGDRHMHKLHMHFYQPQQPSTLESILVLRVYSSMKLARLSSRISSHESPHTHSHTHTRPAQRHI